MQPNSLQQHDDVYAAVFSLVGQKPNETYEGLVKLLPSIKDADPAEVKELEAKKKMREMLKPQADPLRQEYEKAAAEDDVDDLSTEEGDWLGASKDGEDDEEVDENGIPVMKLSRASSSFILDGPGDVKVDNFTPEGDATEGDADGGGGSDAGKVADAAASGDSTSASAAPGYVPTAIARAHRESGPGCGAAATVVGGAAGRSPAAVMTLEDEIGALRVGVRSCSHHQQQQQQHLGALADTGRQQQAEDDADAAEVVPEPPGGLLQAPGSGPCDSGGCGGKLRGGGAATAAAKAAGTVAAPLGGPGLVPTSGDVGAVVGTTLPGTCMDLRHEDSLWSAMQGVEGRLLLEHLGLADGLLPEQSADQLCQEGETGGGEAGGGAGTAATSETCEAPALAAANGHQGEGAAAVAVAAVAPPRPAGPAVAEAGGGDAAMVARREVVAGGGGNCCRMGAAALPPSCQSGEGPTFEEVESFRLDPDFDYDNVQLSVREFPYSMLGVQRPR